MKLLGKHLMVVPARLKCECWHLKWSLLLCSALRALSESITLPSGSRNRCSQQWRLTNCYLQLSFLPLLIFSLCLLHFLSPAFFRSVFLSLLSESECLHFLQQTASRGTRVYFATCGDGSLPRQELAASRCWFLTCVHPFTSMAVRSALLSHPPRPSRFFLPFKGHVEPFDMRFIGLRGLLERSSKLWRNAAITKGA